MYHALLLETLSKTSTRTQCQFWNHWDGGREGFILTEVLAGVNKSSYNCWPRTGSFGYTLCTSACRMICCRDNLSVIMFCNVMFTLCDTILFLQCGHGGSSIGPPWRRAFFLWTAVCTATHCKNVESIIFRHNTVYFNECGLGFGAITQCCNSLQRILQFVKLNICCDVL